MKRITISFLFLGLVYLAPSFQGIISGTLYSDAFILGLINLIFLIPAYALFLGLWEIERFPRKLLRGILIFHGFAMVGLGVASFSGELHSSVFGLTIIPSVAIFTPLCLLLPCWKGYQLKPLA